MPFAIELPLYIVAFAGLLTGLTVTARSRRGLPYRRLRLAGIVLATCLAAAHVAVGIAGRGGADSQAFQLLLLLALAFSGLLAALPDVIARVPGGTDARDIADDAPAEPEPASRRR